MPESTRRFYVTTPRTTAARSSIGGLRFVFSPSSGTGDAGVEEVGNAGVEEVGNGRGVKTPRSGDGERGDNIVSRRIFECGGGRRWRLSPTPQPLLAD